MMKITLTITYYCYFQQRDKSQSDHFGHQEYNLEEYAGKKKPKNKQKIPTIQPNNPIIE